MLNNDYLKGYIAALDNINTYCKTLKEEPFQDDELKFGYNDVQEYIEQVRENYKQLVKDLNENQSKKTTP